MYHSGTLHSSVLNMLTIPQTLKLFQSYVTQLLTKSVANK